MRETVVEAHSSRRGGFRVHFALSSLGPLVSMSLPPHRGNDRGGERREVSQTLGASVGLESSPVRVDIPLCSWCCEGYGGE